MRLDERGEAAGGGVHRLLATRLGGAVGARASDDRYIAREAVQRASMLLFAHGLAVRDREDSC